MIKQVIIIRKDLNMRKGKMVAQGAHASMLAVLNQGNVNCDSNTIEIPILPEIKTWLLNRFVKIVVGVDSEDELLLVMGQAMAKGLPNALILDAGLTEFHGNPTYTAGAIGPYKSEEIDKITGNLKLL